MKTKYNVGDKVLIEAEVESITITDKGIKYYVITTDATSQNGFRVNAYVLEDNIKESDDIDDADPDAICYICKYAGKAPYDIPCSVCARNHADHFEKREDQNAFNGE